MTVLEENEKLNIEIKKIIESLNFENEKIKRKKILKILKIIFIVLLVIFGILLINNMETIKNKIFKTKDNEITETFFKENGSQNINVSENNVNHKIENVVTNINDNQKLFRTTLDDNYAYVTSNSNENVIEREIKVDLDDDGQKEEISFGDGGDGVYLNCYNPTKDKFQFLLSNDLSQNPKEANYYFDNGWIRKDVSYQITVLDLDNDGIKEIIFSAYDSADYGVALHSFVWKEINEEYKYIGNIEGQTYMYFDTDSQSVVVPIGTRGLYSEYRIENNKIVEFSENKKKSSNTTQMNSDYSIYENNNYNYSLEYPNKNFKIISETNDGMHLESYDSRASIYYYITENTSKNTIKSMYEENIDFIGSEIPYKKLGEDFYVLSYIKDGYIEYAKVTYNRKNNTFIQLRFEYTQDYKDIMTSIVERMTKSVRYW